MFHNKVLFLPQKNLIMKRKLLIMALLLCGLNVKAQFYPNGNPSIYPNWAFFHGNNLVLNESELYPTDSTGYYDGLDGAFELTIFDTSGNFGYYLSTIYDTVGTMLSGEIDTVIGFKVDKFLWHSPTEPLVRSVYKITNDSSIARNLIVYSFSNLGSDGDTKFEFGSTGGLIPDALDRWSITSDYQAPDGDPVNTFVRCGTGNIDCFPVYTELPEDGNGKIENTFTFDIPANSTRFIVEFYRATADTIEALNQTSIFDNTDAMITAGYFDGMTTGELNQIINWDICDLSLATTTSAVTITSSDAGATYQWIDCATNTAIAGETSQSFTATMNGNYAVVVTSSLCSDTSACVTINGVGLVDLSMFDGVSLSPNPVVNTLTITSANPCSGVVFNSQGKMIKEINTLSNEHQIDFTEEPSGVYFVKVTIEGNEKTFKFIKQ